MTLIYLELRPGTRFQPGGFTKTPEEFRQVAFHEHATRSALVVREYGARKGKPHGEIPQGSF